MDRLNIFGQPFNETERVKNREMVDGVLAKMKKKQELTNAINEYDRGIEECKRKIQEKKASAADGRDAAAEAKKAGDAAAAAKRAEGTGKKAMVLAVIVALAVAVLTVLSLIKLFPMIKDNMDITVIALVVGAPIALICMMLTSAAGSDTKKHRSLKEIGAAIKKFWDEA